jgi:AcrR family transcriptional regulator
MSRDAHLSEAHLKVFADRRRDPDGKREAILRTAVQLFLDRSYARTALNDIADQLSITKPALYHYFRNKEDILLECYRWGCLLIRESLDEIAAQRGTGIEKVSAFIRSYTTVITNDFGRAVVRLDDGELSREARVEVRSYKREIDRRLRSFIQDGIDDDSIARCDVKLAAFSIAGAINWISTWYKPGGSLTPEQIAQSYATTMTDGLRNSETSPSGRAGRKNLRLVEKKPANTRK